MYGVDDLVFPVCSRLAGKLSKTLILFECLDGNALFLGNSQFFVLDELISLVMMGVTGFVELEATVLL